MLNSMKFICELIMLEVLKYKTIKYCVTSLFKRFLLNYYASTQYKDLENIRYDFYFETIITFIGNLGEKYDMIEEEHCYKS